MGGDGLMRLLLTNDDGVDAPGLRALHDSLRADCRRRAMHDAEIIVVAPDRGRSECGHSITTGCPLHVEEIQPNWFCLDGTPVDCVRVGLHLICPDAAAVFSGINAGANVGVDLVVSGTFAAAREAAILGWPAMAVSHYRRPDIAKTWDHCDRWLAPIWNAFWDAADGNADANQPLWNVNLPAIDPEGPAPSVVECPIEQQPMPREGRLVRVKPNDPRQRVEMISQFHDRPRLQGTDIDQCFGGNISLSRLQSTLR